MQIQRCNSDSVSISSKINVDIWYLAGGWREILFLRQEGSSANHQLEVYLWNVSLFITSETYLSWERNIVDFYCVPHIFYFEKRFNLYFADASRISLLVSRLRGRMTRGHWRRKWRTDSRRDSGGTNQSRMDEYGITICCIAYIYQTILFYPQLS